LGDGVILENFTVEAKTLNNQPLALTGGTYFGGVVAIYTLNGGSATFSKVKVKGDLQFSSVPLFLSLGGFIGEARALGNIIVDRCSSELNITASNVIRGDMAIGSFIGRHWRKDATASQTTNLTFTDCYATGSVTASITAAAATDTTGRYDTGGFIGDILTNSAGIANVTIERCYASGNMSNTSTNNVNFSGSRGSGGFAGFITNTSSNTLNVTIKNSAAVGERATLVFVGSSSTGAFDSSRFAGVRSNNSAATTIVFDNNISNQDMLIGDGTDTHTDDPLTDGLGTTKWGKGVPPDASTGGLKNSATWTGATPGGLGWDPAIWDFDGLAQTGTDFYWPRLK
jgi:hypothetical protein